MLRLFLPFGLGYFVSYLFRTVNAVIAPDLVADLGLTPADLGLLTSAYFLAFAAFQLPLGILLDRFGPRRIEALLLLIAAAGALQFALAESLTGLMVSGGLGALTATTPVQAALQITDWRGIFIFLAGLGLLAAIGILLFVPEAPGDRVDESFRQQLRGLYSVLTSRDFWQIAPWAFTAQSAYLSIQGLWSGPWLRDVAGYGRAEVAQMLWWIAVAMICGYFAFGSLAGRLARRGVPPAVVATCGMGIFILVQLLQILAPDFAKPLWLGFGFFGTACILPYAVLSQRFPAQLSGRCNTALNLLVFVAAFVAQWLIGAVIGLWPTTASGGYQPQGYTAAWVVLIAAQLLAVAWYFFSAKRLRKQLV